MGGNDTNGALVGVANGATVKSGEMGDNENVGAE